ncbi:uncharacterized protein BKCO1_5000051 [Diplodia corticola]|uniref:Uncharacterized protein n=1 Tax=Diplodia corticola TaxID=236234 RepID=A0A1J9QSB3_9PEZI|nr:uncharacterized protein BKCO1_5000051 [Diplodia corticola]OJD31305.1 hypothetical protein BKCO1_5000051 [Diplodia corticola]
MTSRRVLRSAGPVEDQPPSPPRAAARRAAVRPRGGSGPARRPGGPGRVTKPAKPQPLGKATEALLRAVRWATKTHENAGNKGVFDPFKAVDDGQWDEDWAAMLRRDPAGVSGPPSHGPIADNNDDNNAARPPPPPPPQPQPQPQPQPPSVPTRASRRIAERRLAASAMRDEIEAAELPNSNASSSTTAAVAAATSPRVLRRSSRRTKASSSNTAAASSSSANNAAITASNNNNTIGSSNTATVPSTTSRNGGSNTASTLPSASASASANNNGSTSGSTSTANTTTTSLPAPPTPAANALRTLADPVVGRNGFTLLHPQHRFTRGRDQSQHLTLHYTDNTQPGVRQTHTYTPRPRRDAATGTTSTPSIDWTSPADIARLNRWTCQVLKRHGAASLRPDVTWFTGEERRWLRDLGERMARELRECGTPVPTREEQARMFNARWAGTRVGPGERQEGRVRPVRTPHSLESEIHRSGLYPASLRARR